MKIEIDAFRTKKRNKQTCLNYLKRIISNSNSIVDSHKNKLFTLIGSQFNFNQFSLFHFNNTKEQKMKVLKFDISKDEDFIITYINILCRFIKNIIDDCYTQIDIETKDQHYGYYISPELIQYYEYFPIVEIKDKLTKLDYEGTGLSFVEKQNYLPYM